MCPSSTHIPQPHEERWAPDQPGHRPRSSGEQGRGWAKPQLHGRSQEVGEPGQAGTGAAPPSGHSDCALEGDTRWPQNTGGLG